MFTDFFDIIGSPIVLKDIKFLKEVVSKFTITFNYFDYTNDIAEYFYQNLKNFTFKTNYLLNPKNADMINIKELKNLNVNHFKKSEHKQMHIVKRYFTQVGNLSEYTSRLYYNSEQIQFTDIEKILKLANTSLLEYLEYLGELNSELTVKNIDALENILSIYSPKKECKSHEHILFKDVAYCSCGNSSIRKINRTSPVTYYCKTKIKRNKLIPCKYKATHEKLIIEKIKEDTNIFVTSRTDVNKIVEKIIIRDKFDFEIFYK